MNQKALSCVYELSNGKPFLRSMLEYRSWLRTSRLRRIEKARFAQYSPSVSLFARSYNISFIDFGTAAGCIGTFETLLM